MAHLITGYAGHEHIQSADEGAFNASIFGSKQYVIESKKDNCFAGTIIDNNTVRILDGEGLMHGRHFRINQNTYEDVTIKTGTAGKNRVDLICMTYEKDEDDETEKVYLQVVKGEETVGKFIEPEYIKGNILEGDSFNQMPLYKVTIEGVALKKIEPVFEKIQSYENLIESLPELVIKEATTIAVKTKNDILNNYHLPLENNFNTLESTAVKKSDILVPLSSFKNASNNTHVPSAPMLRDILRNFIKVVTFTMSSITIDSNKSSGTVNELATSVIPEGYTVIGVHCRATGNSNVACLYCGNDGNIIVTNFRNFGASQANITPKISITCVMSI